MGLLARLDAKLDRSGGPDACWPFTGAQSRGSGRETTYGSLCEGGKFGKAWRVNRLVLLLEEIRLERPGALLTEASLIAALATYDRLHKGEDAAHACDWGPCGNPSHLAWKPHAVNVREQQERKRKDRVDCRITSEMLALAAKASIELRAEFGARLLGGSA